MVACAGRAATVAAKTAPHVATSFHVERLVIISYLAFRFMSVSRNPSMSSSARPHVAELPRHG
jgi:hypothetical protein